MYLALKKTFLYIAKFIGLFSLSKVITRRKLRILCYHGFSCDDQTLFRPKLFTKKNTFESRMDYLIKNNFAVINLSQFDDYLNGRLTCNLPVLLTIDDGWKSTHEIALPILRGNKIPHIIYLYTDCHVREIPVLNVLLQYALWKTNLDQVERYGKIFKLKDDADSKALLNAFLLETSSLDKNNLTEKLSEIFQVLKVDYSTDREWNNFSLLTQSELKEHLLYGGSIQLHTHHHVNPLQDELLVEELSQNKRIIESVTGQPANHFCYPSGAYSRDQFPLLKKLGIKSAVTCIPGLNDENSHPYELKRFLDGENISQIEFEAEMSGFLEICRRICKRGC